MYYPQRPYIPQVQATTHPTLLAASDPPTLEKPRVTDVKPCLKQTPSGTGDVFGGSVTIPLISKFIICMKMHMPIFKANIAISNTIVVARCDLFIILYINV